MDSVLMEWRDRERPPLLWLCLNYHSFPTTQESSVSRFIIIRHKISEKGGLSEINRDWLPLSVADERLQTSWGCEKQTKSTMRNETGVLSTTIPSLLVMEAKK
jgi:hypothetical protein